MLEYDVSGMLCSVHMNKITLPLSALLHQRLIQTSKAEKKSLAALVREILNIGLVNKEASRIEQSYEALDKMIGIYKDDDPNLASSVDEILYDENGAWKGNHE